MTTNSENITLMHWQRHWPNRVSQLELVLLMQESTFILYWYHTLGCVCVFLTAWGIKLTSIPWRRILTICGRKYMFSNCIPHLFSLLFKLFIQLHHPQLCGPLHSMKKFLCGQDSLFCLCLTYCMWELENLVYKIHCNNNRNDNRCYEKNEIYMAWIPQSKKKSVHLWGGEGKTENNNINALTKCRNRSYS